MSSRGKRSSSGGTGASSDREDDSRIKRLLADFKKVRNLDLEHGGGDVSEMDVSSKKAFFSSITNSPDLQNVLFRYLSRDRDRRSENPSEHGFDAERQALFGITDILLCFYRHISSATRTTGSVNNKPAFTLASVAKDLERSRPVVIQYIPHLITIYLLSLQNIEDKKKFKFIETFLLVIYNCEAMETANPINSQSAVNIGTPSSNLSTGQQQSSQPQSVNVPGLSQNSVYHDSVRLEMSSVELERIGGVTLNSAKFDIVKTIDASTRPRVLHLLFHVFNNHIMDMPKSIGLESFMKAMLRVLGQGHEYISLRSNTRSRGYSHFPRIHLPAPVLTEILFSAHHCIFNGLSTLGNQVVDLVEVKAAANGWGEVLLVANAMTNLTKTWSGDVVGRGLRAATTDAHYANSPGMQLAKNMITNASFRVKKISEDIPKVLETKDDQERKARLISNMKSITEELGEAFPVELLGADASLSNATSKTPTKTLAENVASKAFNKDKFISKLPNLKVGIQKKMDRLSENASGDTKDGAQNGNGTGTSESCQPGKQRPSFEFPLEDILPGVKKRNKEEKQGRGDKKSDDKTSKDKKGDDKNFKGDGKKSDNKAEKKAEEKAAKAERKAEEKATKQDKKKEKSKSLFLGNPGIVLNHSSSDVVSGASDLNSQSTGDPDIDSVEKVEELIQMKRLPQETITIHSPESGTTIF